LPSFGQKLKAEREKRSITLDQISLTTKIGTRMLQALEEDKFSQLPGGIFNKGFVRAYARCVGIDEDQAVSEYLEASGEAAPARIEGESEAGTGTFQPTRTLRVVPAFEAEPSPSSRQIPWGLFAAGLLVVALALSVWTHRKHEAEPVSTPVSTPAVAPSSDQTPANIPAGSAGRADTAKADSAKLAQTSAAEAAHATAPISTEKNVVGTSRPTPPAVAANPQPADAQPGEFTVLVQGREDCWVSITADGKAQASYLLSAGQQRAVRGRQSVMIKAGNAGGLDVLFNGRKIAPQGGSGEVKTLIFGPEGLEASSSATETPE
jgi:cytoskeleton protein RodZ